MTLLTLATASDRSELVNALLGRAFGLSGGLLRKNQLIDDLTPAERRQILEAMQRRYPVVRGSGDGRLRVSNQPALLKAIAADPLAQLQLDDIARVREALKAPFAVVRGGLCHPDLCPSELIEDVEILELRFADLVAALADDAPGAYVALLAADIAAGLGALAGLVDGAEGGVETATAAVVLRRQATFLETAARPIAALGRDGRIVFGLQDLSACVRCIEEAIEGIRRLAADLGLTDCDLAQLKARPTLQSGDGKTSSPVEIDLATGLEAIARSWRLIAELIARDLADTGSIAAEAGRANAIARAFAALEADPIEAAFGLDAADAARIRARLGRLARRTDDCAKPVTAGAPAAAAAAPQAPAAVPPPAAAAAPPAAAAAGGPGPATRNQTRPKAGGKAAGAPADDLKDMN